MPFQPPHPGKGLFTAVTHIQAKMTLRLASSFDIFVVIDEFRVVQDGGKFSLVLIRYSGWAKVTLLAAISRRDMTISRLFLFSTRVWDP
jgi:hypothetical protein